MVFKLFYKTFFKKDFIYLLDRKRERENKQGEQQAEGEGEAGSPRSKEPKGLDLRTPVSRPAPKADA